ncbi:MAG: hypothetical protein GX257_00300 [Clostridiales bacterium]|jgi:hypothetical protein|nr:hypothetical protein [Clostridiales bacterium]
MDSAKRAHMEKVQKELAPERHKAIPKYEYITAYPIDKLVELSKLEFAIMECEDDSARRDLLSQYAELRDSIKMIENPPEKVFLWREGNMPVMTEYTDNSEYRYYHDPDFMPYFLEILLPDDVTPIGAVITIAGGQQGMNSINECYEICRNFNDLGYQAFILHSRPNACPWNAFECGVDVARAIRIIRRDSEKYRIPKDRVAVAGFSNGGIAGDNCIRYFSGDQAVKDHFPDYVPDDLDAYYGSPDVFLCVYGSRHIGTDFDYTRVVYPPSFFATGLKDERGCENMYDVVFDLVKRGVMVEVHSFAGHPHGYAGWKIYDGIGNPNFDLWVNLADNFMRNAYNHLI